MDKPRGLRLSSQLLPEFFSLLGVDVFLLLSLLSCLLDDRVPKTIPYMYQVAALIGYGHLLISKEFLAIFGEYTRFWYSFIYLVVALSNTVAVNLYFAIVKNQWTLAKFWSGAVTFPTVVISTFFVSNYAFTQETLMPLLTLQAGLIVSAVVMGIGIIALLSPEAMRKMFKKNREVKTWKLEK